MILRQFPPLLLCLFFGVQNCLQSSATSVAEELHSSDATFCNTFTAAAQRDEIATLPGLRHRINFRHFSGYLKTNEDKHNLHYWFVTSQNNPCEDPLIFWFNGGPGCSSLEGLLSELGPYFVNLDGKTLQKNPHSWNKNASIVFIESPVGVGYSFSSDGNLGILNNELTASANYAALKQFFLRFPLFRPNSVFIAGESYAGIYVPMLVEQILEGQPEFPINLEGMAIGNGVLHSRLGLDAMVRFAYGHGLVGEDKWREIEQQCCGDCADICDLGSLYGTCHVKVMDIIEFIWDGGLNPYDLFRDCAHTEASRNTMAVLKQGILGINGGEVSSFPKHTVKNSTVMAENVNTKLLASCLDHSHFVNYLNLREVRNSLHIPSSLPKWITCNHFVSRKYVKNSDADMAPYVLRALQVKLRVLFFFGDTDMVCNFLLGQRFADQLGLRTLLRKEPWNFDGQIGGFKTTYAGGLTFTTVRGAGHMVPAWRPAQMEHVIRQFMFNRTI